MADRTGDWFFAFSRTTTDANGTKTFEIRAGGRPAMVSVMGLGLFGFCFLMVSVLNPPLPWWVSAIGCFVFAILFTILAGWQIYLAERGSHRLSDPKQADE